MSTDIEAAPPAPTMAGTFAIYDMPDGAAVLVISQPDPAGGPDVVSRKVIPSAFMRMIRGEAGGLIGRRFRGLMGDGA